MMTKKGAVRLFCMMVVVAISAAFMLHPIFGWFVMFLTALVAAVALTVALADGAFDKEG